MLIVSSLSGVDDAYRKHRPARVISLLSDDECVPTFAGLSQESHLKLYVEQESCAKTIDAAARLRAAEIVEFLKKWDGDGDLLIHCNRGVSRSMGAAFIALCMLAPDTPETQLAARLRKAAPHADPCPLIVTYADELLGRDGAMADAIDDLSPPAPAISAPVMVLPTAA